jgi:hypothetical protein
VGVTDDGLHAWIDALRAQLADAREREERLTAAGERIVSCLSPVVTAAERSGVDCTPLLTAVALWWELTDPM